MRFTPLTLIRIDRAPKWAAQASGRSSDRLALRSFRNEVDCTNGRASPVTRHALVRAWPAGVPPSGARLLQSYSDSVWFCATPPFCQSHRNANVVRGYVRTFENPQRNLGFV